MFWSGFLIGAGVGFGFGLFLIRACFLRAQMFRTALECRADPVVRDKEEQYDDKNQRQR